MYSIFSILAEALKIENKVNTYYDLSSFPKRTWNKINKINKIKKIDQKNKKKI